MSNGSSDGECASRDPSSAPLLSKRQCQVLKNMRSMKNGEGGHIPPHSLSVFTGKILISSSDVSWKKNANYSRSGYLPYSFLSSKLACFAFYGLESWHHITLSIQHGVLLTVCMSCLQAFLRKRASTPLTGCCVS